MGIFTSAFSYTRMIDFKGHRFEKDIILTCVRWRLTYSLSYRNLEEMMAERGVRVDHSNLYRWVVKFTPPLEATFRKSKKRPVGKSGRMDETSIKIKGQWKYLYRVVDTDGQTLDFLLTAHRDQKAALRFFKKAVRQHGLPDNSHSHFDGKPTPLTVIPAGRVAIKATLAIGMPESRRQDVNLRA